MNIFNIQKNNFSSFHSKYHILLNEIKKSNNLNQAQIISLLKINNDLLKIQNDIDKLTFDICNKKRKNKNSEKNIELLNNHKKDNIAINAFLPAMIYLRMLLENNDLKI